MCNMIVCFSLVWSRVWTSPSASDGRAGASIFAESSTAYR